MGSFAGPQQRLPSRTYTDTYIEGIAHIELAEGGYVRAVCFINRKINGETRRVISDEAYMIPIAALPDAVGKALMVLARHVVVSPEGSLTIWH